MRITVDGVETEVLAVEDGYYGAELRLAGGLRLRVFPSAAEAGRRARDYWEDMANDNPEELACIVGSETLVAWALGLHAGPGSIKVGSLNEWLDLSLDKPARHWNRVGNYTYEIYIEPGSEIAEEVGFDGEAVGYPQ